MTLTTLTPRRPDPSSPSAPAVAGPVLDVVVPVYNEETDLEPCVRRLHEHLRTSFPYPFRITIADNDTSSGGFNTKINFQPAAAALPAGYIADTGATFGVRNGLSYGWSGDNTSQSRDRHLVLSPDQRFDLRMQGAEPPSGASDLAKQLLVLVGTLMTSVTSFYFATRGQAEQARKEDPDAPKKPDSPPAPPPPRRYGVLCCQTILLVRLSSAVNVPLMGAPIGAACVPPM